MEIDLTPIGFVKNNIKEWKIEDCKKVTSEIIIKEDLKEALSRIDEFSHIIVIYWMHKLPPSQRSIIKVHPKGNHTLPLVGVFASRSPARPNPIGITTVKLLERRGNVLKVTGLDAIDGTPVLDIKPYIPDDNSPTEAKTPGWLTA
ncbi:MAG: tRNA (N6-threonylcarbamoyladenosine(37)-N6)-methyltransferase TrmO [Chloroflexi bacterium]|nr:tRNA (N6-threonylcarbamoyladenosine(37)-N6)-methyltransferase TrmO [Chloroflexota bacterium]MBL7061748.1 tRNA (N6-threonylcarbamoyladenosine(37)-N6)-methyltransferase TrmO [Dehalococcoidia bacterium]